jgi:hypothetical protein
MDHATKTIMAADESIPNISTSLDELLPFEEAVSMLKGKVPLTKREWSALEPKLRFRAFTVARLSEVDYIEAVRGRLLSAVENGEGFAKSWADIKAIAKEEGAYEWKPGYWETVYRTNIQSCYVSGKLMQYEKTSPPAYQLFIIDDNRTTAICRALLSASGYGIAMPANHPFWKIYGFPPYHYGCRDSIRAVRKSEIGRTVQVENPSMTDLRKTFKPMKGFGGNPIEKESWWKLTDGMIQRAEKYGIIGDILQQAHDLGMTNYQTEMLNGYSRISEFKNGGYLEKAKNGMFSQQEIADATDLAKDGNQIYLLPQNNMKSPDMLINNEIGEMKRQTVPEWTSIKNEITEAGRSQHARTIIIHALPEMSKEDIEKGIYRGMFKNMAQKVILKWQDKTWVFDRKTINKGDFLR